MSLRRFTVAACRERIAARNAELRAVLRVLPEPDRDPDAAGGPLGGVPYVLKDTWDTAGIVTTGGSYRHRARVPAASSHAHAALRRAGAVLLGKSNLCDLAFSTESDNHLGGPVRNPHDPSRTAGGSTGGGAAAVASGMAAFDWGTDFGGSIRAPAGYCGVVGLRLSHAAWPVGFEPFPRISPFFHDFCGMGPLTTTVDDAAEVLAAVAPELRASGAPTPELSPDDVALYLPDDAHAGRWPSFGRDVRALLADVGVRWSPAELPAPEIVNDVFNGFLCAHFPEFIEGEELPIRQGAPAVLASLLTWGRLDKRVHPNTALLLATVALGHLTRYRDAARADEALEHLRKCTARVWAGGRLIVSPTCTELPPKHGRAAFDLTAMTFCKLGNAVDATGVAIPFGRFDGTSLPRSLQVLGPPGSEGAVLDLARRLERAISAMRAR